MKMELYDNKDFKGKIVKDIKNYFIIENQYLKF